MSVAQADLLTYERELRDAGAQAAADISCEWMDHAWSILLMFADRRRGFTADDVRERVGDPPRPNAMGALMRKGVRAGLIEPVGYRQSSREGRHAGLIRLWRGL